MENNKTTVIFEPFHFGVGSHSYEVEGIKTFNSVDEVIKYAEHIHAHPLTDNATQYPSLFYIVSVEIIVTSIKTFYMRVICTKEDLLASAAEINIDIESRL